MALIIGGTNTALLAEELRTFLARSMPTSLDGVSQDLDDWIDGNEERLGTWLDNLMEHLGNWVDSVSDQLSDAEAGALSDWLDNLESDLETFIETGLEALDNLIDGTQEADEIRAGGGDDDVDAHEGNDMVYGEEGDDDLDGGAGDDLLDGGVGNDRLAGGMGNDTYIVDDIDDIVLEVAGAGVDLVNSSVSLTLSSAVENLRLTGSANLSGTGNGLANQIIGNAGNNIIKAGAGNDILSGGAGNDILSGGAGRDTLNGGANSDRMAGGLGNDTYIVESIGDAVVEASGSGTDQVRSSISLSLQANVENLVLTGSSNLSGTGNGLANQIIGNAGNNIIKAGAGNDILSGGAGRDRLFGGLGDDDLAGGADSDSFHFNSGDDVVEDFQDNIDTLMFDDALWGGGARSASSILSYAKIEQGDAVFNFGNGNTLTIENVTSLRQLSDDVSWF